MKGVGRDSVDFVWELQGGIARNSNLRISERCQMLYF